MKKKIFITLFSLIIIISALSFSAYGTGAADSFDIDNSAGYYGREALSGLENSKALLYAYDKISDGVANALEEINIYDGANPITADEARTVLDAYRRDRGEHFWLGNSYTISYNQQTVLSVIPTYTVSGEQLSAAKAEFLAAADELLSGVTEGMSEFEIELYLHDALARRVSYVDSPNAHNSYGAIVEGKAVCEGYAEALQYLYARCGIRSFIAVGMSNNPESGASEGHAWNIVRIDGKYYHVDLTWNDQGERIYHAYFNLTDSAIEEDHIIEEAVYPLPECNSTEDMYFSVFGGILPAGVPSVEQIGKRLRDGGLSASFYSAHGVGSLSTDAFIAWVYENIQEIANAAGVDTRFAYVYSTIGREVFIELDTCRHTSLTKRDASPATCTEPGSRLYYECECGKLFWNAKATQPIEDRYDTVIEETGHTPIGEFEHDSSYHWQSCRDCEGAMLNKSVHHHDNACDAVCNVCEDVREITHKYTDSCDTDCDLCGETREIVHVFSGTLVSDASGHFYECICGVRRDFAAHIDADSDGACDSCFRLAEEIQPEGAAGESEGALSFLSGSIDIFGYNIDKKILIFVGIGLFVLILLPLIFRKKEKR